MLLGIPDTCIQNNNVNANVNANYSLIRINRWLNFTIVQYCKFLIKIAFPPHEREIAVFDRMFTIVIYFSVINIHHTISPGDF